MPKELGLFCVFFLNIPLYIQWNQFTIVHVTLPTQYYWLTSTFMLVFRRLQINILNIVTFLNLKVILGDHPTRCAFSMFV